MRTAATCLFACDLGDGLGHLRRLVAIARHLDRDAVVVVAATPLQRSEAARLLPGARVLPSPGPIAASAAQAGRRGTTRPGMTAADALHASGFADWHAVAANVEAWRRLVDDLRPDVVVSDFAPSLRVAIGSLSDHIVVGSGFTVPPRLSPLPTYELDEPHLEESLRREAAILGCLNAARTGLSLPAFSCLADALRGDETYVASLPCLDPYDALRRDPLLPPFDLFEIEPGPALAERYGPHVFGYLDASDPGIDVLLTAFNRLERRTELFVRGIDPEELQPHCAGHVGLHRHPPDLFLLLPQTRLLVHHGGLGLSSAGLSAGVPQLVLPRHKEQELTAQALRAKGTSLGVRVEPDADPDVVRDLMVRLLTSPVLESASRSVAAAQFETHVRCPERPIVDACQIMLSRSRTTIHADHPRQCACVDRCGTFACRVLELEER